MNNIVWQIYIAILKYGYKAKNLYITYDTPYIVYREKRPFGGMALQEYIDSLNK